MKWRRRLKWPVTVVAVLLLVVWTSSRWFYAGWAVRGQWITIQQGALGIAFGSRTDSSFDSFGPRFFTTPSRDAPLDLLWSPSYHSENGLVGIPLWVIVVPVAFAAVYLHRTTLILPNDCTRCGYDLSGVDGGCPECGGGRCG